MLNPSDCDIVSISSFLRKKGEALGTDVGGRDGDMVSTLDGSSMW